jgi:ribosomal protein S27AE
MVFRWCLRTMRDLSSDTATRGETASPATECPECGAPLLHTNGCLLCGQCGYSPCD